VPILYIAIYRATYKFHIKRRKGGKEKNMGKKREKKEKSLGIADVLPAHI